MWLSFDDYFVDLVQCVEVEQNWFLEESLIIILLGYKDLLVSLVLVLVANWFISLNAESRANFFLIIISPEVAY